jgi:hypothetical protein
MLLAESSSIMSWVKREVLSVDSVGLAVLFRLSFEILFDTLYETLRRMPYLESIEDPKWLSIGFELYSPLAFNLSILFFCFESLKATVIYLVKLDST